MVRTAGLEPAQGFPQGILSPLRLPFRHVRGCGQLYEVRRRVDNSTTCATAPILEPAMIRQLCLGHHWSTDRYRSTPAGYPLRAARCARLDARLLNQRCDLTASAPVELAFSSSALWRFAR